MSNLIDEIFCPVLLCDYTEKNNVTYFPGSRKHYDRSGKPLRIYYLGADYPGIYVTLREAQCLYLLTRGKTFGNIAGIMALSPRTVEYYVKNVRAKMRCVSKVELIAAILQTDFLKIIGPEVILCND